MVNNNLETAVASKGPSKFAILKIRNFRYYWGATVFSLTGEHIEVAIRSWLIWELTHSIHWLMAMVFMHWIPHTLLAIPAGSLAESVNRQRLIVWSEIILVIAALGMFITTYIGVMDPYWMGGMLIVHSIAGSLSNPSRQLLIHDMVGREHLLSGVALTSSLRFATMSVGKPVGGIILLYFGAAWGFFVNALTFLPLILVLSTVIRVAQMEISKEAIKHPFEEFKHGLKYIRGQRTILATIGIAATPGIFIGSGFDPFLAAYSDLVFGWGAKGYTYFITAMGIGALIGAASIGWVGNVQWKGKLLVIGIIGYCLSVFTFAFSTSISLSIAALIILGLSQVLQNSAATTILLGKVPSEMRGRMMGVFNFSRLGLRVINGPFLSVVNKLATLTTVTAFSGMALTLSIATSIVVLITLGLGILEPNVSKEE